MVRSTRGRIEGQAVSKEMRCYPWRWRSLPALWEPNANQGVRWRQRKTRTQCVFLYPLVLLHEQELQNDFGDACALQDGVTRVARAIRRACGGTKDMVRRAVKAGVSVHDVHRADDW